MRTRKRLFGGVVAIAAGTLLVAACSSGSSASGSGASTSGSSSGASASASGAKTVTIGLSSILSGPYAVYGEVGQGIQAYLDAANASGGINGYKFKVEIKDNQYQPTQSVQITRSFASDGALAIFELGTPASQAAITLGNQLAIPLITTANGDLFAPPPSKYVFATDPQFSRMGVFEAQFILQNLHTKQFAFAYENDDLGTPAENVVPKYVADQGGKVLTSVPVDATATDFSSEAIRLKNSGATVVQAFIGTAAFAGLQKAAAAIGYHPTWVTFFTQDNEAYVQLVGASLANGVYADNFLDTSGTEWSTYKAAMEKYYPSLVNAQFAQLGWSQAAILGDGIDKATQGGAPLTAASLTTALDSLTHVPAGFLPSITFTDANHAAGSEDAMFLYSGAAVKQVTNYAVLPPLPAGVSPLS